MFKEPIINLVDAQYRHWGYYLQNKAKLQPDHELKIKLTLQAISQFQYIKIKTDEDIFEISYSYYRIAIIYRTNLNDFIQAQSNLQHAINYIQAIQHPDYEDTELLKEYYWQFNKTQKNYYIVTKEEADSPISDMANEQDIHVHSNYKCR